MSNAFPLLLAVVSAFPPLESSYPPGEAFPPLPVQEEAAKIDIEPEEPKDYCVDGNCGKDTELRSNRIRLFRPRR